MKRYDPLRGPDPERWLALSEEKRIRLVAEYHRRKRVPLPSPTTHAAMHAAVETQVALGDETPVRATLERLLSEGLDRHEAIHAVASVLARKLYETVKAGEPAGGLTESYYRGLEALTAESWRHGD